MLKVNHISAAYGGIKAIEDVSLEVNPGEIVAVLGSNGAGKSTLLKCISSLMRRKSGEITFENQNLPDKSYDVVKMGVILVPEGRQIFADLTVFENLMAGAYLRNNHNEVTQDLEKVYALFPRLKERGKQYGGLLSGGEQQMLAIGRGLMGKPKLLMMDEPSLGLAPIIVTQIFEIFEEIRKNGTAILLVEQNAFKALTVSDRAYVMNVGRIVKKGMSSELIKSSDLIETYLGS